MPEDPPSIFSLIVGMICGFFGAGLAVFLLVFTGSLRTTWRSAPAISFTISGLAVTLAIVFIASRKLRGRFFLIGFLMGLCAAALLQGICFSQIP